MTWLMQLLANTTQVNTLVDHHTHTHWHTQIMTGSTPTLRHVWNCLGFWEVIRDEVDKHNCCLAAGLPTSQIICHSQTGGCGGSSLFLFQAEACSIKDGVLNALMSQGAQGVRVCLDCSHIDSDSTPRQDFWRRFWHTNSTDRRSVFSECKLDLRLFLWYALSNSLVFLTRFVFVRMTFRTMAFFLLAKYAENQNWRYKIKVLAILLWNRQLVCPHLSSYPTFSILTV